MSGQEPTEQSERVLRVVSIGGSLNTTLENLVGSIAEVMDSDDEIRLVKKRKIMTETWRRRLRIGYRSRRVVSTMTDLSIGNIIYQI